MSKILVAFISVIIGLGSAQLALAKKPDDAGGKSAMKEHRSEMKEMHKGDRDDDFDDDKKKIKDKAKKERDRDYDDDDDGAGLAKQREKKAEQERKELGKGSEQGQSSREEHSRKWWKFWE